uniref:Neur_chan_LBD domain-containing protein n=1 Tax=Meloidogyne hapla TaxID=6305 RepID=A0A1I8B1U0_MELHA
MDGLLWRPAGWMVDDDVDGWMMRPALGLMLMVDGLALA